MNSPNFDKRFLHSLYKRIVPRSYSGIGAVLGAVTITELFMIWYLIYLPTGWPPAVYLPGIMAVLLTVYFIIIITAAGISFLKKHSYPTFNVLVGTFLAFILVSSYILGLAIFWAVIFAFLLIPPPALLGAAIGNILQNESQESKPQKRLVSTAILILAVSANILLAVWLFGPGSNHHLVQFLPY